MLIHNKRDRYTWYWISWFTLSPRTLDKFYLTNRLFTWVRYVNVNLSRRLISLNEGETHHFFEYINLDDKYLGDKDIHVVAIQIDVYLARSISYRQ